MTTSTCTCKSTTLPDLRLLHYVFKYSCMVFIGINVLNLWLYKHRNVDYNWTFTILITKIPQIMYFNTKKHLP